MIPEGHTADTTSPLDPILDEVYVEEPCGDGRDGKEAEESDNDTRTYCPKGEGEREGENGPGSLDSCEINDMDWDEVGSFNTALDADLAMVDVNTLQIAPMARNVDKNAYEDDDGGSTGGRSGGGRADYLISPTTASFFTTVSDFGVTMVAGLSSIVDSMGALFGDKVYQYAFLRNSPTSCKSLVFLQTHATVRCDLYAGQVGD